MIRNATGVCRTVMSKERLTQRATDMNLLRPTTTFIWFGVWTIVILLGRSTYAQRSSDLKPPLNVFLLAGQSNMAGADSEVAVPPGFQQTTADRDTLFTTAPLPDGDQSKQYVPWGDVRGHQSKGKLVHGPEVGFARTLHAAGWRNLAIIKVHANFGRDVQDWPWSERGALFDDWMSFADARIAELVARGHTIRVRGFLWHQGIDDAIHGKLASHYERNLGDLISVLRKRYADEHAPFILARSVNSRIAQPDPNAGNDSPLAVVRRSQVKVGKSVPFAAWIDVDDLPNVNTHHFSTESQLVIGKRFGEAFLKFQKHAVEVSPYSGLVRSDEPVRPSIDQQPLFKAGEDGYFNYRIPSLVVTTQGTVLALCEARKKTGHDWDDVDLALKRSTDHGRTWSKMQIIADEGELTINQPCPVIDHKTGTIWLPLCRGSKPGKGNVEVLLMRSTDDGQTWSRPISIHQSVTDPSWTFVGTGPGHGIQLKSGRLLIPCWFDVTPTCGEVQSSCCIYSDDHGVTWKRGEPLTRNASDECDVVELEDGTVYLNARSRGQKQRAYAFSKDGGQSWSAVQYDPHQPEPSCDGALIRLSDSRRSDKNRVLVACPTNPDTRAHIRVRMSYDECRTWPIASEPLAHLGGYSDLAVTGDRQVLCLYETWPSYKEFSENRTNLVLAAFNVEWLSAGKDTLAAPHALPKGPSGHR